MRVGVISDTHGLLRPEALRVLAACDHIVHAGDVGSADVLAALSEIAPLTAVRGNNDRDAWAIALPESALVDLEGVRLHVVHDIADLSIEPPAAGVSVVVAGHSHKPSIHHRDGVLFLNPGSAGPRRFSLPITVAMLDIDRGRAVPRIIHLNGTS